MDREESKRTARGYRTGVKKERMEKNYLVWNPLTQKWEPPMENLRAPHTTRRRLEGAKRINQINRLAERDGLRCHWCNVDLTIFGEDESTKATIDHYPVSKKKGGTNKDSNAVLSCKPCNQDRDRGRKGRERIKSRKMFIAWQRDNA